MQKDTKNGKKIIKKSLKQPIEEAKKPFVEEKPLYQVDESNLLRDEELMRIGVEGEVQVHRRIRTAVRIRNTER